MFTLHDILLGNEGKFYLHGTAPSDPATLLFRSAHHDSRQIQAGDLFIAIKGAQVDGHRFIPAVAQAGAAGVLCSEPSPDAPAAFLQIVVPDVVAALLATARARVQRQPATILLGITGSNGKTGTKEAVAAVLARKAPTLKTYASYNNEIGFPLTLLNLEPQHCYAVLEMGAEWVGELAWLAGFATPRWSIVTNVGSAHLRTFGSKERIASAKSELVQVLPADGLAILNYDDPYVRAMRQQTRAAVLFYGLDEQATVRASAISGDALQGYAFLLQYQDTQTPIQLRQPGLHGVTMALAAAAAGFAAAMPPAEIKLALEALSPVTGRNQLRTGPNGSKLINDTYKANPQSIEASVRMMAATQLPAGGKRWAILGDMFDLEPHERDEHYNLGQTLFNQVDALIAIGHYARFYAEGAIAAGMPAAHVHYFTAAVENAPALETQKQAAVELLQQQVRSTDLILLTGSHGMHMETMLGMF